MNEKLVKQLQEALFKFLVENNALFWYLSFARPISEHTLFGNSSEAHDFTFYHKSFLDFSKEEEQMWNTLWDKWQEIRNWVIINSQEDERRID